MADTTAMACMTQASHTAQLHETIHDVLRSCNFKLKGMERDSRSSGCWLPSCSARGGHERTLLHLMLRSHSYLRNGHMDIFQNLCAAAVRAGLAIRTHADVVDQRPAHDTATCSLRSSVLHVPFQRLQDYLPKEGSRAEVRHNTPCAHPPLGMQT